MKLGVHALLLVAAALSGLASWRFVREPAPSRQALDLLALVDEDGDGRVSAAEYERVTDGELPLKVADADGSGWLEGWEVEAMLLHLSPLRPSMSRVPRAR